MAYQHKEGQGSLFENEKFNVNQPDLRGSLMIGGKLYSISAWQTTSRQGKPYLSLKAEPYQARPAAEAAPVRPVTAAPTEAKQADEPAPGQMYRDEDFFAPENPLEPDLPF